MKWQPLAADLGGFQGGAAASAAFPTWRNFHLYSGRIRFLIPGQGVRIGVKEMIGIPWQVPDLEGGRIISYYILPESRFAGSES